jgi:tetratricopeptide (TPR) repeat protein
LTIDDCLPPGLFAGACAAALLAAVPAAAEAQKDRFLQGVVELTDAVTAADESTRGRVAAAVERMKGSLAEWDRAIRALEASLEAERRTWSPQRALHAHLSLAAAYLERGRFDDAVRELDAAAAAEPRHADLHVTRALALEASGRPDEAARTFRTAWTLAPTDPVKAYYALQRSGTVTDAEADRARVLLSETYQRIAAGGTGGSGPESRAGNAEPRSSGQRPAAPFATVVLLPDHLSRGPVLADAASEEGFALLARQQYDRAVEALARAGATPPRPADDSPIAHLKLGRAYEALNRVPEARRQYEAAAAGAVTGRSPLYRAIARLARVEGDFAGTVDALERAVLIAPNDAAAHQELAHALLEQGRLEEAFRELVATLLIDPQNALAHAAVGQVYLDLGRPGDAVTALRRAAGLMPERYEFRYPLATALSRLGRTDEAAREREAFERGQREAVDRRRREIAAGVQQEEALLDRLRKDAGK